MFTSSSGGTHAGLLAGRAAAAHAGRDVPDVVAIGVAKGVNIGRPDVAGLANQTLTLMQSTAIVAEEDVEVDTRWIGDDYAVPTDGRRRGDPLGGPTRWLAARPHVLGQGLLRVCSGSGPRADSAPTWSSCTPAAGRRCSPRAASPPERCRVPR